MSERAPDPQRNQIPIPDPTTLTTEALGREVHHLHELLQKQIEIVASSVGHLKELTTQRFNERDLRFAQGAQDNRDATAAALAAAKEAVEKSEAAVNKQIESIMALITNSDKAREEQIRVLEKRVDRDEGKGAGLNQAWLIGIAAIGTLISIAVFLMNLGGP